jgi:hypothetical protein
MNMKKIFILILALTMTAFIISGCGAAPEKKTETEKEGGVKTGLGVVSSVSKSTDAEAGKDGFAQVDSTVAAVLVDKDGKIVKCKIDAAQTKISFSADGKITTPLDGDIKTKQELGDTYGMKKASGINKEWNEQADAFASYVTGKTLAQVKGIAVNEEGVPTESDLTSSVTVHITDFTAAIEKAVNNAQDLGAKSGDNLGLGIITTINKSANAAADKDGLAQAYSVYTATTFASDGKITSSIIDASQTDVNFSADGKITSDLKAENKTKNELGDAYGMKKASGIKKEWNEQAASFADYIKGKTLEQVKGIAVNEEGVPTESDLTSSVTIHISDFIGVIEKASANAR